MGVVNLQRVVASRVERTRLIRACHDDIDGSHFGRDKNLNRVSQVQGVFLGKNFRGANQCFKK